MHFYVYTNNIWMPLDVGREERLNCKINKVLQTGYCFLPLLMPFSCRTATFVASTFVFSMPFDALSVLQFHSIVCLINSSRLFVQVWLHLRELLFGSLPNETWSSSSSHNSINLPSLKSFCDIWNEFLKKIFFPFFYLERRTHTNQNSLLRHFW